MRFTWILVVVGLVAVTGCEAESDPDTGPGGDLGTGSGSGSGGGGGGDQGPACGPNNCDGCCDGDQCLVGTSDDSCGAGGAACQACGAYGECDEAAICVIARDSRWDIVVESATVSPVNQGGTPWDDSEPDVYAKAFVTDPVTYARSSPRTQNVTSTSPVWNTTLVSNISGEALEGIAFELLDEDDNPDDPMGRCSLNLSLDDLHEGSQTLECPRSPPGCFPHAGTTCEAGWSLRYRLVARTSPRPGAAAVSHHALPAITGPIGECFVSEDWVSRLTDGTSEVRSATRQFDSYGRRTNDNGVGALTGSPVEATCGAPDAPCYAVDSQVLERYEASSTGRRLLSRSGDGYLEVFRYDSLGRMVRRSSYYRDGSHNRSYDYTFRAQRMVMAGMDIVYDARGRMVSYQDTSPGGKDFTIETDANGLPARAVFPADDGSVSETLWTFTGPGCARRAPIEWTNGPLLP